MRLIRSALLNRFAVCVLSGLVLTGCGSDHYGVPDDFKPPRKAHLPPPPPPPPPKQVVILAYGSVRGDDAIDLLSGDIIALRFLALKQLAEDWVIPPEAALSRINANKGALLPLTQPPPSVGLDRVIPSLPQIFSTVRTMPPQSNAMTLVLDSILPQVPKSREVLAPQTKEAARKVVARLARLAAVGLITADEQAQEQDALYALINSDRIAETDVLPPPPPPPPPPPKHRGNGGANHRGFEPLYIPDPSNYKAPILDEKSTGPAGLYLMQIPDPAQADKSWTMLKTQSPELASLGYVLVRTDLGAVGITWRLVAGPVKPDEARKLCEGVRPKNQDCTPIPFPKNGTAPPAPKATAPAPAAAAKDGEAKEAPAVAGEK